MSAYTKLGLMFVLNLMIMFLLTYATIASFDDFVPNLNRLYMAILMAAPMSAMMVVVMPAMFPNKRLNSGLYAGAAVIFLGAFLLIRTQAFIGNRGLLEGMIPHHSGAVLMCRDSKLTDPEVRRLCTHIIQSQQQEIADMKALLKAKPQQ